jgi:hypothetical protein
VKRLLCVSDSGVSAKKALINASTLTDEATEKGKTQIANKPDRVGGSFERRSRVTEASDWHLEKQLHQRH